jgi:hypothetical protein
MEIVMTTQQQQQQQQQNSKKVEINTYDFLSVVSLELQVSPPTVNSVTRVALALFPERIERIEQSFVPNLWVNRILIQLPDGLFGIVDANLWSDVHYYLVNFSGVDKSFYTYDRKIPFEQWFADKVAEVPTLIVDASRPYSDIPNVLTKEYVDISNRILISMYVIDAFGSGPREGMNSQLKQLASMVSDTVVNPPN